MLADSMGWADPNRIDYYNYLYRRDNDGGSDIRLEMNQVAAMMTEMRKKEELSVEVLTKRRKICELLHIPAEQAVSGL